MRHLLPSVVWDDVDADSRLSSCLLLPFVDLNLVELSYNTSHMVTLMTETFCFWKSLIAALTHCVPGPWAMWVSSTYFHLWPPGPTTQIMWGLLMLHSKKGAAQHKSAANPLYSIVKHYYLTPEWHVESLKYLETILILNPWNRTKKAFGLLQCLQFLYFAQPRPRVYALTVKKETWFLLDFPEVSSRNPISYLLALLPFCPSSQWQDPVTPQFGAVTSNSRTLDMSFISDAAMAPPRSSAVINSHGINSTSAYDRPCRRFSSRTSWDVPSASDSRSAAKRFNRLPLPELWKKIHPPTESLS